MAAEKARGGIGLALGGGAARTLAHVGVLKVLVREGIAVGNLAGTSGGALIAVLVASGYPLEDIERDARSIGWRRIADFRPTPLGIMSTERLGRFVRRAIGDPRFEDLRLPCAVVAADLTAQARRVFRSGPVVPAVEASCAIPEFYRPVDIGGHSCTDGGVVEPLPIHTLVDLTVDCPCPIVAVNVLRRAPKQAAARNVLELIGQITQLVQYQMVLQAAPRADLLVEPEVGQFPLFDLDRAGDLIAAGEQAMERSLPELLDVLYRWEQGEPGDEEVPL
jgi:NTE family protein